MVHSEVHRGYRRAGVRQRSKPGPRRSLYIELLEDRCVPTTITPTTFADGVLDSGSLRDAVLQFNADSGSGDDTIQLLAGTYALTIQNRGGVHETAGLTGDLNLTQPSHRWIIQGAGPSTIIDASPLQDRVFQILNPGTQVVFQDLVIQGGLAQDDGTDGALAGTTDALGGGILNNGGDVTLGNVVVQNNVARGGDVASLGVAGHNANGGGIYSTGGALTLAGATLANNQASGGRGGDHNGNNRAGDGGSVLSGGLYATGGFLDISDSRVAGNRATGGRGGDGYQTRCDGYTSSGQHYTYTCTVGGGVGGSATGGGLYVNGGSLTIASSAIATNQATGGNAGLGGYNGLGQVGGLYNLGTLTVSDSTLSGNTGGGISNSGTLTVSDSTVSGNSAFYYGGGIYNSGTLTVSDSTLSGNSAFYFGGGIYNGINDTATISNSILSGNSARYSNGGGISNSGTLTVSNSTLSGNSAFYGGGGISNSGTLTVSNSTLSGNSAASNIGGDGGGIYNYADTLTVSNSTLSGNSAGDAGGGIFTYFTHPVTLTNVTLTANRSNTRHVGGRGGGLSMDAGGSPVLHNTLIAGNFRGATGTTRDDVDGDLDPSGDYNLIGDRTGMTGLSNGVNGNQVGSAGAPIDPLLGPLQGNGGLTLTHALLPGSPAIDAGNNAYATDFDQRGEGFPRIVNGIIDIGAFEVQADGPGRPAPRQPRGHVPVEAALIPANFLRLDRTVDLSSRTPTSQPLTPSAAPNISLIQNAQARPAIAAGDQLFAWLRRPVGDGLDWGELVGPPFDL